MSTPGPLLVKPLLPAMGSAIVVGAVTVIVGELVIVATLGVLRPSGAKVTPAEPALARVTLPLKFTALARVRPPPSSCKVPLLRVKGPTPNGPAASVPPATVLLAQTGRRGPLRLRPPLKLAPVMPSDSVPPWKTMVSAQDALAVKVNDPGPAWMILPAGRLPDWPRRRRPRSR